MDESIQTITSSLLQQARARDAAAWDRLVEVYSPLIYNWCRRRGLTPEDCEDVGQQVFASLWSSLADYRHEHFLGWLKTITENKIRDLWRRRAEEPTGEGGTSFQNRVNEWPESPDESAPSREEQVILQESVLDLVSSEFSTQALAAFRHLVIEEKDPADVAAKLGMTRNQVYLAKSRILRRLRDKLLPE
jgi:RNA polymerase sigma-70 factor (ECF subfamily)